MLEKLEKKGKKETKETDEVDIDGVMEMMTDIHTSVSGDVTTTVESDQAMLYKKFLECYTGFLTRLQMQTLHSGKKFEADRIYAKIDEMTKYMIENSASDDLWLEDIVILMYCVLVRLKMYDIYVMSKMGSVNVEKGKENEDKKKEDCMFA